MPCGDADEMLADIPHSGLCGLVSDGRPPVDSLAQINVEIRYKGF